MNQSDEERNPYAPSDSRSHSEPMEQRRSGSLIYEFTLFGGIAFMLLGVLLGTLFVHSPAIINIGTLLFALGVLALVVTLR